MKPDVIVFISTGIAVLSFVLSFYVYWKTRTSERQRQAENSQMRIIASQSIIFWEQLQTLVASKVLKFDVDSYIFESLKQNARRLEDSIEHAIAQGLWHVIVPSNKRHSVKMHIAFIQGLVYASSLQNNDPNEWMKVHLLMGVARLLEICENYEGLDKSLRQEIKKNLPKEYRERSWIYLNEISQTNKVT